ncbi:MAG: hypothetical protein ABIY55_00625 [Kofleriaceae bacterium]
MTQPPHPPLFTPVQAAALLDQLIYEQVLESVDLDALYRLEQSLTMMVGELHGVPFAQATESAKAVLDRCVLRLPDDIRRYLRAGPLIAFDPSGGPDFGAGSRCEERPASPPPRRPPPPRRLSS